MNERKRITKSRRAENTKISFLYVANTASCLFQHPAEGHVLDVALPALYSTWFCTHTLILPFCHRRLNLSIRISFCLTCSGPGSIIISLSVFYLQPFSLMCLFHQHLNMLKSCFISFPKFLFREISNLQKSCNKEWVGTMNTHNPSPRSIDFFKAFFFF